jgi:hypothetical protein
MAASAAPPHLLALVGHYLKTEDINGLARIPEKCPALRPVRVIDQNTQKSFLVFDTPEGVLPLAASLSFSPDTLETLRIPAPVDKEAIGRFVASRAAFLFIERQP